MLRIPDMLGKYVIAKSSRIDSFGARNTGHFEQFLQIPEAVKPALFSNTGQKIIG
jgi:hypothetical protein